MKEDAIASLDIGSTTTRAIVAAQIGGRLEVIGVGETPSEGIRRGVISDFDRVVRTIEIATEEAERMAGTPIASVYLGIGGEYVRTHNSRASVAIVNDHHEVAERDVVRALEASRRIESWEERRVLHAIAREYVVDGLSGVADPVGMEATRLEVDAHVVCGGGSMLANMLKCVTRAGLDSAGMIYEPLAASAATLDLESMRNGVLLLDIGGASTDLALYARGRALHTSSVPLGGASLTSDLAVGLRSSLFEAERLKRLFHWDADDATPIHVERLDGAEAIPHAQLRSILVPRLIEILTLVRNDLLRVTDRDLHVEQIVVTGGGALLGGIEEAITSFFGLPTRRGIPSSIEGLTEAIKQPQYSTAIGLLVFGPSEDRKPLRHRVSLLKRATTWIGDLWN